MSKGRIKDTMYYKFIVDYGGDLIENDKGFISYQMKDEMFLILDMYTESKNHFDASDLAQECFQVALDNGYDQVWCLVEHDYKQREAAIKTFTNYGFNEEYQTFDGIYFSREISG